jgi:hypothetical protein
MASLCERAQSVCQGGSPGSAIWEVFATACFRRRRKQRAEFLLDKKGVAISSGLREDCP